MKMTDAQFIEKLKEIKDPIEAIRALLDNENLLGFDPYYADLRAALLAMLERNSFRRDGRKTVRLNAELVGGLAGLHGLSDKEHERLLDVSPAWSAYQESLVVEVDLASGAARLLPSKEWA